MKIRDSRLMLPRRVSAAAVVLLVALLGSLGGCGSSGGEGSPSGLPITAMHIGSRTYQLEIAADDFSREHGLMQRDSMPADHGMIFVFAEEKPLNFWMENTRIPLDILFLDSAGKVVSVHTMKPYDRSLTPSEAPARYAIELNAGAIADDGAKVGEALNIPPAAVAEAVARR
jgi:uncharacterized membrane protein (UPF0127 family)